MRLPSGPLHLLVAMARGGVLREAAFRSRPWFALIWRGREDLKRVHARSVNTLRQLGLIEREDAFDWRISAAGSAWLATNGIAAALDKSAHYRATFPG